MLMWSRFSITYMKSRLGGNKRCLNGFVLPVAVHQNLCIKLSGRCNSIRYKLIKRVQYVKQLENNGMTNKE